MNFTFLVFIKETDSKYLEVLQHSKIANAKVH